METNDKMPALYAALAQAQAEFPDIAKDSTVKVKTKSGHEYTFDYAELPAIIRATRPILTKHGLAVFTTMGPLLTTVLAHKDGGVVTSSTPMPNIQNPQELGAFITYMRRYQYSSIVGVMADDDHDANELPTTNAASFSKGPDQKLTPGPSAGPANAPGKTSNFQGQNPASDKQRAYIKTLAGELGLPMPQIKTSADAQKAIEALLERKKAKAPGNRVYGDDVPHPGDGDGPRFTADEIPF